MSSDFPGSPHTMSFVALMGKPMHFPHDEVFRRMGIVLGKITHTMEKYEYQYLRFTPYEGFCCIFPYCDKFMGKPMHFPNDDIG